MRTLSAAERWLRPRLEEAPGELAEDLHLLLRIADDRSEDESGDAVADLLARAGLTGLDQVADRGGGRESALRLLAADAALTFAFEAAAELGGDVDALCERLGPGGEIGRRLASRIGAGGGG